MSKHQSAGLSWTLQHNIWTARMPSGHILKVNERMVPLKGETDVHGFTTVLCNSMGHPMDREACLDVDLDGAMRAARDQWLARVGTPTAKLVAEMAGK